MVWCRRLKPCSVVMSEEEEEDEKEPLFFARVAEDT